MFHSARLKLTAWYLLIIMCISVMFSVVIYTYLINEVQRFDAAQRYKMERRIAEHQRDCIALYGQFCHIIPTQAALNDELLVEAKKRILFLLGGVNTTILVLSGAFGYMLAGRTLKPIKEMMDEQNRFVSDASHELRTPLTSLKSSFEVYLRSRRTTLKESNQLVKESLEEVNKMQALSESMLQLAQYQKPNGHMQFELVELQQIIKEAEKRLEPIARQKKIAVHTALEEVSVYGNKYSLVDLIVILLDNAIKYSPSGSTIIMKTKKADNQGVISVVDQGIGIEEKDRIQIFDRFYRADSARSKNASGGYGLGLSIAKKIVDIHKGSIDIASEIGKGTTFTIRLPQK